MSKPVTEDLFSFSGRRNRKSYILASLLIAAVMILIWCVAGVTAYANTSEVMLIVAGLLSIPAVITTWALGSQRCRDFGWTGWAMLITLIPYVGWIFAIAIMFIPGNQGPNRYGPDMLGPSAGSPLRGMAV
ncbi:MAG TPA: DUF805 domain-containing protein [Rhodopila sp.]|nr:DUF805 domain-containing protein [Rhodopila sp.]